MERGGSGPGRKAGLTHDDARHGIGIQGIDVVARTASQAGSTASPLGHLAAWWGLIGFVAVLSVSLVRLGGLALQSVDYSWSVAQAALFAANLVFMLWFEAYRGFQQKFSPRFARRAVELRDDSSLPEAILAPLVLMGMLYAPRRQLIVSWSLTVGIVAIVLVYRTLPQPWRGILDAGVFAALLWGTSVTALFTVRALTGERQVT